MCLPRCSAPLTEKRDQLGRGRGAAGVRGTISHSRSHQNIRSSTLQLSQPVVPLISVHCLHVFIRRLHLTCESRENRENRENAYATALFMYDKVHESIVSIDIHLEVGTHLELTWNSLATHWQLSKKRKGDGKFLKLRAIAAANYLGVCIASSAARARTSRVRLQGTSSLSLR